MGGELFERLSKKGKFTERDATFIVFSILSGLETLHQRHIVHRVNMIFLAFYFSVSILFNTIFSICIPVY